MITIIVLGVVTTGNEAIAATATETGSEKEIETGETDEIAIATMTVSGIGTETNGAAVTPEAKSMGARLKPRNSTMTSVIHALCLCSNWLLVYGLRNWQHSSRAVAQSRRLRLSRTV
jgi:hypothetical protein